MAQVASANYPIPNDTGANFRADVNENLSDLYSTSSGSSAPPASVEGQMWIDTSTNPDELKVKQGSSWITLGTISTNLGLATAAAPVFTGSAGFGAGSTSNLSIRRSDDQDTGIYFAAANELNIQAGGTEVHEFTSTYSTPKVPLRVPDGTAGAPSVTNAGDENTGLYFSAADTVGITTGGTKRAEISSTGLIIPDQKELRLNDSDNSNYVGFKAAGTTTANVSYVWPAADAGTSGYCLKSDGSGNLSWGDVNTGLGAQIKGYIAFTGGGSTLRNENLTLSKTGTGEYTINIDSGVQTGNTNYGVVITNISDGRWTSTASASTMNDHQTQEWNVWLHSRSNGAFYLRSRKFDGAARYRDGGDDEWNEVAFNRSANDPDYIALIMF